MTLLKFLAIAVIVVAVSANPNYRYSKKYLASIIDLVLLRKSNTCVILVVDGRIKFVSTEEDAPRKLAKCRNAVNSKNVETFRIPFKALSPTDVVEKLVRIGETRNSFLVYFTSESSQIAVPGGSVSVSVPGIVQPGGNLPGSPSLEKPVGGSVSISLPGIAHPDGNLPGSPSLQKPVGGSVSISVPGGNLQGSSTVPKPVGGSDSYLVPGTSHSVHNLEGSTSLQAPGGGSVSYLVPGTSHSVHNLEGSTSHQAPGGGSVSYLVPGTAQYTVPGYQTTYEEKPGGLISQAVGAVANAADRFSNSVGK